ncbi:MAG: right-handed parallel beta-helix repeat-containing protein, partial [Eubacterium sp.]
LLKVGTPGTDTQAHGFYYQNITINGGSWDRCQLHNSTGIKIAHAANVTLENAELFDAENSHLVETAGVDGLTIRNCEFHDSGRTSPGNAGYECVQIDVLSEQHFNGYEALDTELDYVSKNITVENCSFDHVVRTVGSHTAVIGKPFQSVVFKNNTVTNCEDAGFYMRNVQGLQITGNRIQSRGNGINVFNMVYTPNGYFLPRRGSRAYRASAEQVNGVIANNTIDSSKGNGIYLLGRNLKKEAVSDSGETVPKGNYYIGNIKVKNNTIRTHARGVSPVLVTDGRNISIVSNKISGPKKKSAAIRITGGSRGIQIKGNKISH